MRILHLIDSDGVYGAERILLYLARQQKQQGHEPCIGSIRRPGVATSEFEALAQAWGLALLPIRVAPVPTLPALRRLLKTVRGTGADVLHSHGYKADVLFGPIPRRWRGPMLTTVHGWSGSPAFSPLWWRERLDQVALKRIELVVAVARAMLVLPALRNVASERRRVITNGIPSRSKRLADLASLSTSAPQLPEECVAFVQAHPTLVAIGRLSPEKGFNLLLEAFARAKRDTCCAHQLVIVGDGPEAEALTHLIARLELQGCVRLAGYIEGADRLLADAAGFVMSSYTEGMPLVLLEALQWNVPILATAVGAIPELLTPDRGQLVPPRSLEGLTKGLAHLMSSHKGRIESAHAEAPGRDESARMAGEYLQAYASIV
jgi:glycosyltransferase involved in cell wall biosynthesis